MRDDQHRFLTIRHLPSRVTAEQAAWLLNCQVHDIPALVAAKLIKPLGHAPQNATKFFATADVLEHTKDRQWLARMSTAIYQHWHSKNHRQKEVTANVEILAG
jgi:hypothetical protein